MNSASFNIVKVTAFVDIPTSFPSHICYFVTSTQKYYIYRNSLKEEIFCLAPGLYEPAIAPGTILQYWRGDKTWQTLDKAAVGLSNVDNTTDLNKPISTATQTALNGKADLDPATGKLVTTQLPAIALSEFCGVLTSNAAMTAPGLLTNNGNVPNLGDWCNRSDQQYSYILGGFPHTVLSNWIQILAPASPVLSVNTKVGHVVIDKTDVGLGNVPNVDATNPANIVQTSNYRFVTDLQINTWNAKQDALVSGVNIKTINGVSVLGIGNISTYLNTGNVIYVATTGSDAGAARANRLGLPNLSLLTLDAAVAIAQSGDLIYVFPGAYTATGNIAKNGVNWHFEDNTTITKTTAGLLFDTTGHILGFDISGKASFIKSSNAGNLFYFAASNLTHNIECASVTCSVAGSPIFVIASGGCTINLDIDYATNSGSNILTISYGNVGGTININAISWKSTAGPVITGNSWYYTTLNVNASYFGSTVSSAITMYNIGCSFNLNIGRFEGAPYSLVSGDGGNKLIRVNCTYMSGISDVGDTNKYYVSGHCREYNGSVTVFLQACNYINITGGYFKGNFDMGLESNNNNLTIYQSGGVSELFIDSYDNGVVFAVVGGTMNLYGNVMANQVSNNGVRSVQGGTLNLHGKFVYGANLDGSYNGYSGLTVSSGALRINGAIQNVGNDYRATGIEWTGGNIICENATIVTANQYAHAIRSNTAGLNLKVTGRISTNRVENDALLGGKYLIYKWQINAVATTQIIINGTSVQETNTVVYNTTALLANRMVTLINTALGAAVLAYQTTAGTDTFLYVRALTKGGTFTVSNGSNATQSLIQLNSYPMGVRGSGLIICDAEIIC
jgi:hypothetical protein